MILIKVIKVQNIWFVTFGFLIMDSNFKIRYAMVVYDFTGLSINKAILLLPLFKMLIFVALFIILANLNEIIYQKIMYLKIAGIY